MIERNRFSENAFEIKSKAHAIRTLKVGDKMMFSASDILLACGVKAPTKWIERNAYCRPDMTLTKFDYPVKTAKGYRKIGMLFCTAAVGKKLVKATACPDETERWIMDEVLTYRIEANNREDSGEFEEYEKWVGMLWQNMQKDDPPLKTIHEDDINRRIDKILLELLEIKRWVLDGTKTA